MNICLLNDSFPPVIDGVANVVMNYGRILSEDPANKVLVGTPAYPGTSYEGYPYEVVAYPSCDTTDLVAGYRTGNPLAVREIEKMASFGPDIIHTHCPAASTVMARILQKETGAPVIFTYHTKFDVDISRAVGEGFLKKETLKAMVSNISACDEVWVVSEGAGENLRSIGFEGEYRVMVNGVDFPKGRATDSLVRETVKDFDLPGNVPIYLFVGRIIRYKGLPLILEALRDLSETGREYRMVFVGSGPDAEMLQQTVREYGISLDVRDAEGRIQSTPGNPSKSGRVIFAGPERDREKLRAWNTRADLFLFPSVYDTNGIVVREAAACGLASVLIRGSCAAEGITHDRNGFLMEESAEALKELLLNPSMTQAHLREVGEHAMEEIYISWEESVKAAYRRYGEIRQRVAEGKLLPRKPHGSDMLLQSAARVAMETMHLFDIPRNIYGGMKENIEENLEEMRSDLRENVEEFREDLQAEAKNFSENAKSFGENARNFGEKAKQEIRRKLDRN